jgi:hypothetical protein
MAGYLLLVIGIAVLFYAVLPAFGAFLARGQWRRFRRTVTLVSHYPTATPGVAGRERSAPVGYYRFFGTLEAIQGDDRIWLTNGRFSVAADLRNVRVYLIPEAETNDPDSLSRPGAAAAALGSVPWNRIFSLPEGTPVFVGGALFSEEGRGVFRDNGRTRLLVVIHDCPKESLVLRAISGGRQRNEYMNALTLPSVAIGSLSLVLFAFTLLALPERIASLLALTAGLAPLSPFLPPGFPLYFAYRSYWKKARLLRVQRDMVRLPLRYFPTSADAARSRRATLLPDMEPYLMVRGTRDPADPEVIVSEGARLALPPDISRVEVELPRGGIRRLGTGEGEVVAFCGYTVEDDRIRLRKPDDPMAGHVLLPGDPEALSKESERAARRDELISATFIALDVVVNLPLVFILLSLVIR